MLHLKCGQHKGQDAELGLALLVWINNTFETVGIAAQSKKLENETLVTVLAI